MTGPEIAAVSEAVEVVGNKILAEDEKIKDVLLRAAEDTSEMKAAARSKAARIAAVERIKLKILEPFARLFGVGEAYFIDRFPEEIAAKLAQVPDENIITPSPSVAGPALIALSYVHEETDLKEMYLNLLTAASDNRRTGQAHPAFAEIIKQLTPSEAVTLTSVLKLLFYPVARIRDIAQHKDGFVIHQHTMSYLIPVASVLSKTFTEKLESAALIDEQVPTWIENWQRLGLISVHYDGLNIENESYDWVTSHPEYLRLAAKFRNTILFDKGMMRSTSFGRQFINAVT